MTDKGRIFAYIDLGTNSIRLLIVRLNANYSYTILRHDKEVARLGEKEYENGRTLSTEAISRAVLICRKFVEVAKAYGAKQITAVATSAVREAGNRKVLLGRLHREAGLDVRVVSGKEEARLVYLGVSSGAHIGDKTAAFIDIGGGSTEIAIGNQHSHEYLDSLELGCIRLTSMFLKDASQKPVSKKTYEKMREYAKNRMLRASEEIRARSIKEAYGSSGTIVNLAQIATKMNGSRTNKRDLSLKYKDLKKIAALLCSLPLSERKKVAGINPDRADIIIGGTVILDAIMEEFRIEEIKASERGLLHGMLINELSKLKGFPQYHETSVRDWSVMQLGRSCNLKEKHAGTVTKLALELFDSGKRIGLHALGEKDRSLLKYAAFLHDVGDFVSYSDHNIHSHYIIKNSELLGFDQEEINAIAAIARYHAKKMPKRRDLDVNAFDEETFGEINIMSAMLRLAESLDRSHGSPINKARFSNSGKREVTLKAWAVKGCELEKWGIESNKKSFERTFKKTLKLRIINQ